MKKNNYNNGPIKKLIVDCALPWRTLLLLIGAAIVLLCGQPQSALAAGFSATTGNMITVRQNHTATLLNDGRVLITGGTLLGSPLKTAEIYNPATGEFTATGDMSIERQSHTATKLANGRVLIAGGRNASTALATAEIFDPAGNGGAGSFTATGSMTTSRGSHTATLISGNKVLVAGGLSTSTTVSSAEIFDPISGAFTATGNMSTPRRLHAATILADGRVLIAGGSITSSPFSSSIVNTAEIYDPVAATFSPVTSTMTSKRNSHTATLLADGRVLIAGGYLSSNFLSSAEIFDPAGSGSFTATALPMAAGHGNHTATRLPGPDGKVLIAGGYTGLLGPPDIISATG